MMALERVEDNAVIGERICRAGLAIERRHNEAQGFIRATLLVPRLAPKKCSASKLLGSLAKAQS